MSRNDTADLERIFLDDVPLMDVRAPVEFAKGAFPQARSLPLMDDQERHEVGLRYKQQGQDEAIALGHQRVSGSVKAARMAAWSAFARAHPEGYLYCFRGGLRSQTVQAWLKAEAGIDYPRVLGGSKAMRSFLIETLDSAAANCPLIVVGGLTGTGKTELLAALTNAVDLEQHANHRGSSFGKRATSQPSQINFENAVSIDFLKKRHRGIEQFVLEDESRLIGACALPVALEAAMRRAPVVWLEDSRENRIQRILSDYVVKLRADHVALNGEERGVETFEARLRTSLANIARRLGGDRYRILAEALDAALAEQARSGSVERHHVWIEGLLDAYYDPIYAGQGDSRQARIVFRGDRVAVRQYLEDRQAAIK